MASERSPTSTLTDSLLLNDLSATTIAFFACSGGRSDVTCFNQPHRTVTHGKELHHEPNRPLPELESLRSQVAELSRELAERDRSMQDQSKQSGLLRAIVEGTATETGEEFFRSLVRHLAQTLNVRYAFVGEWREQAPDRVRALAV